MIMKTKYNICVQGTEKDWFFNGYFLEEKERKDYYIPEIAGIDTHMFFFDEKFNKVIIISKSKVVWIKEAKNYD